MLGLKRLYGRITSILREKRAKREKIIAQGLMMSACIRRIK
jgi:hypothetical protein